MKVIADKIKAIELQAGDLFSTANQAYWDTIKDTDSIGERVFIRTNAPCPKDQEDSEIYKIIIVKRTT